MTERLNRPERTLPRTPSVTLYIGFTGPSEDDQKHGENVKDNDPRSHSSCCLSFSPRRCVGLVAETAEAGGAPGLTLLLENVRDLKVDIEELGGAAVEADALALIELALVVVGGDALFGTCLVQAASEEKRE